MIIYLGTRWISRPGQAAMMKILFSGFQNATVQTDVPTAASERMKGKNLIGWMAITIIPGKCLLLTYKLPRFTALTTA